MGNLIAKAPPSTVGSLQDEQSATIALEDDALNTLGVSQTTIDLINKTLQEEYNSASALYISDEWAQVASDIQYLKNVSSIMMGIQIASFGVRDIQAGYSIEYAMGDTVFSGAGMAYGGFAGDWACGLLTVNPALLVSCGLIGAFVGTVIGHKFWLVAWRLLHGG